MNSPEDVLVLSKRKIIETTTTKDGQEEVVYEIVSDVRKPYRPMGFALPGRNAAEHPLIGAYTIGIRRVDGNVERSTLFVYNEHAADGMVRGSHNEAFLLKTSPLEIEQGENVIAVGQIQRRIVTEADLPKKLKPSLNKLRKQIG